MVSIVKADSEQHLEHARTLFREYTSSFAGETSFQHYLVLQNFEEELLYLPNGYVPPEGVLLLALEAEKPAGCVAVRRLSSSVCEMKRLYVKPEFRRLGVGKKLVNAAIEKASGLGYERMRLDTLPSMKQAQALYASLGFKRIAAYCDNPVEGAVFMELWL